MTIRSYHYSGKKNFRLGFELRSSELFRVLSDFNSFNERGYKAPDDSKSEFWTAIFSQNFQDTFF